LLKQKRVILRFLVAVLVFFSAISLSDAVTQVTVEAATKTPTVRENSQTLYTGYKTHTIGSLFGLTGTMTDGMITTAKENKKEYYQCLYTCLNPGTYYIQISVIDGYSGSDIPYLFALIN